MVQVVENEILHYEDITFRRDGKEILKGVNWHVNKGENWALLGLNGAGKSTMLSFIPAYQTATSGTLRVLGYEFGKHIWSDIKARVGFVSSSLNQFSATMDRQTVENIVISGAYSSIGVYKDVDPAVRQKALGLIEKFSMTKR
ncbi:MAG: ATP-binding cassette domain-containing protein, partial [Veillonella sp.]|nr:ATP-binding cassette domain-containing protein [Veillonella sp.]